VDIRWVGGGVKGLGLSMTTFFGLIRQLLLGKLWR